MPAVRDVLVVGGGAAGSAVAIHLARSGVAVDLVESKTDISAVGSGITLQGNALRELRALGIWEQVLAAGYPFDSLGLRAPDAAGTLLVEMPDFRTGGPDLPATLGMPRAVLARLLLERAAEVGVKVHLGTTYTSLQADDDGVDVTLSDGGGGRYDLVVAADGIRSSTRSLLGIDVQTRATGMAIWRSFTPRPASITRTDLIYGGQSFIAGYCPTGEDSMYAYIVERAQDRSHLTPAERLDVMRELSLAYHGPWDDLRPLLTDPDAINYTHFETHVLPGPWNRGRVVLIGDAAHSCPPTVAQGAAQALEDAAVLSELLLAHDAVDDDLWTAFTDRRYVRAKAVVDASVQLGQWLLDDVHGDVPALMAGVTRLVAQPA